MEDPITGEDALRGSVEAEEQDAVAIGLGTAFTQLPEVNVPQDAARPSLLIIAEGPAAAMLCDSCLPGKQAVGSVQLAAVPAAEGSLRRKEFDAHSATVYRLAPGDGGTGGSDSAAAASAADGGASSRPGGSGGGSDDGTGGGEADNVLLIACSREVLPERAGAWVRGVLGALQPQNTLVISSMPAHQFRGSGDAANDVLLFTVTTSAAAAAAGTPGPRLPPPLPSGTLISGLAAAVISHSQVRQQRATSLVGVQTAPVPDAAYLRGLATAVQQLLQSCATSAGSRVPWRADAAALRTAGIKADRAYRAASTSSLYT